jgi:hypothetical protein
MVAMGPWLDLFINRIGYYWDARRLCPRLVNVIWPLAIETRMWLAP